MALILSVPPLRRRAYQWLLAHDWPGFKRTLLTALAIYFALSLAITLYKYLGSA
ncbi:MAG: hypothetical protein R3F53_07170 [Gammaproteobacteria bacterium]